MLTGHRDRRWWRDLNVPLLATAAASLIAVSAYSCHATGALTVPGLDTLENASIDARFRLRGSRDPGDRIVIVGIDDRTRAEHPEVFQSRRGWADLLHALERLHPRAVGLDAMFGSPDLALTPETIAEVREAHQVLVSTPIPLPEELRVAQAALASVIEESRGDEMLAAALSEMNRVYLGALAFVDGPSAAEPVRERIGMEAARYEEAVVLDRPPSMRPPRARYVGSSIPLIAREATGIGFINATPDDDGVIRTMSLVLESGGRYYMPMGMVMALAAMPDAATSYVAGEDHVRMGDRRIPVDRRGRLMLSFLGGADALPYVSAADVLSGDAPAEAIAGKLVFIGFTDAARDTVATPFDPMVPGVQLHATLAHNLLTGEFLRRPGPLTGIAILIVLGVVLTMLELRRIRRRRAWMVGVAGLGVIIVYLLAAYVLFAAAWLVVPVAAPVASCVFITLCSTVAALVTEGREKAELRAAFSQYVSDQLVDRILADPGQAQLGGRRRELTVLFSDIRGFSRFSEKLEPEELSDFLNEYLTPMTELVMDDGGMLDKYIGDAVMAVYGAPIDMHDHAARACRTALAMLGALEPLNAKWRERGLPEIAIGVGLNTGPMSVGNMGSRTRFDYTVMGDAVNLGARLEGLTKEYRVDILTGESTATEAHGFVFRELDLVQVIGRERPARIFELLGVAGRVPISDEDLDVYHEALAAYRDGDWDAAERGFRAFLERHPIDGPSSVMLARIERLRRDPPGKDWDGVFAASSK